MAIGIIGWGSLIWSPGTLALGSAWHLDGPLLPLEFARISSRDRATLVISELGTAQQTYWASATSEDLDSVLAEMRMRESTKQIHFIMSGRRSPEGITENTRDSIQQWLSEHPQLNGCVWTGLKSNWDRVRQRPFSIEDTIDYLTGLPDSAAAKEYIEKTPAQIQTPLRRMVRERLGWNDIPLPNDLFAVEHP